jgi:nitrate reductase NapE component
VLIVRSFRATPVERRSDASRTRALVCWAAFVVCVFISKAIGFVASFALLCWFVATMLFAQRQHIAMAFALGAGASFWLVFVAALDVALPRGPWGF